MHATKITDTLWAVEEVYPVDVIEKCQQQNINEYSWIPLTNIKYTQAHLPRRVLTTQNTVFSTLNDYIANHVPLINKLTSKTFSHFHTDVWADYPGYTISKHLDNDEIYVTLQVYLTSGDENLGTSFGENYEYTIPYKTNTGYLMVNSPNSWHGMKGKVPNNFIRLSSYTRFGQ